MTITKLKNEALKKAKEICSIDGEVESVYAVCKNKEIKCFHFVLNKRQEVVFDKDGNVLLTSRYKKYSDYPFHRIVGYKNEFVFYKDFVANLITKLDNYHKLQYEVEFVTYDNKKHLSKELSKSDNFNNAIRNFSKSLKEELNL